jgi:hypothetical protein
VEASGRAARIAANESRFRAINHRLAGEVRDLVGDDGELVTFVCECGLPSCTQGVRLSIPEYGDARRDAMQFVVVPGHEIPDVEDVVAHVDRYTVVRKHEPTRPIVEERDPT